MYKTILVPIDGSDPSAHALNHALNIAERYKAKIMLLAVVTRVVMPILPDEGLGTLPISTAQEMVRYQERLRGLYEKILKETEERIRSEYPDLELEIILKEGRPSTEIVQTAEKNGVDLIVMGSRGVGGITGWILGSTSRRVVDSCTKPILIVK
jgi:nucleotide-binding universal stress UspA family protein